MTYIKVKWLHSSADNPVLLYSELDPDRWEVRKVEIYADGRMDFASETQESGGTFLGLVPVPPLDEIAADAEFQPETIAAEDFESVWQQATRRAR